MHITMYSYNYTPSITGQEPPALISQKHDVTEKDITEYTTPDTIGNTYIMVDAYNENNFFFSMEQISPMASCDPDTAAIKTARYANHGLSDEETIRRDLSAHSLLTLDPVINNDIRQGKVKVLIFHALEGYYDINFDYVSSLLNIPKQSFIWLSGDFDIETHNTDVDVECRYINFWERNIFWNSHSVSHQSNDTVSNLDLILSKHRRSAYNTVYNRRIRDHRVLLMSVLKGDNLLDKQMIWSWGGSVETETWKNSLYEINSINHNIISRIGEKYRSAVHEVLTWGNLQTGKPSEEDLNINLVNTINYEHVKSSVYQLVCETFATDGKTTFLSEKSFKPFMLYQPFVVYGDKGTISALRQHGYSTYDSLMDHSYDNIVDSAERLLSLSSSINKLNSFPLRLYSEKLYRLRDEIEKNKENLMLASTRFGIFDWL